MIWNYYIIDNAGIEKFLPDVDDSEASFEIVKDNFLQVRYKFNGNVKFFGRSYNIITSAIVYNPGPTNVFPKRKEIIIRCNDFEEHYFMNFNYIEGEDKEYLIANFTLNDKINKFYAKTTNKYNVLGENKYSYRISNLNDIKYYDINEYHEILSNYEKREIPVDSNGRLTDVDTPYTIIDADVFYLGRGISECDFSGNQYIHRYNYSLHIARIEAIGYYENGNKYPPDSKSWHYLSDVIIDNITYPLFGRKLDIKGTWTYDFGYIYCSQNSNFYSYFHSSDSTSKLKLSCHQNIPEFTTFTQGLRFYDVLKNIVNNIDPEIKFEDNEYFSDFLKNFQGENLTINGNSSEYSYKDLLLVQITDAIPDENENQKDGHATIGYLTFQQIENFLNSIGIFWYLELKSDGFYYFKTKHYSEIISIYGNLVIDNYKGQDFSRFSKEIKYDNYIFSQLKNEMIGLNIDFISSEIFFNSISKNIKTFGNNTFFTDIEDIRTRKGSFYDENSLNQFVVLATIKGSDNYYYVRNATGLISNLKFNNSELSFISLAKNLISNVPNLIGTYKNLVLFFNDRLQKRENINIKLPISCVNEIDINKNIRYYDTQTEIKSIKIYKNNMADLTLNY